MADSELREWVMSLGIREEAAIAAVVAVCHSEGCRTPKEAAGTRTTQVFTEGKLKELLAGQKMNVRKKVFNGLEQLGGRARAGASEAKLSSPDAPTSTLPSMLPSSASPSPSGTSPRPGSILKGGAQSQQAPRTASPGWSAGDRALVREIFETFNESGDGRLKQAEYAAFCGTTEGGAGCDDQRWRSVRLTETAAVTAAGSPLSFSRACAYVCLCALCWSLTELSCPIGRFAAQQIDPQGVAKVQRSIIRGRREPAQQPRRGEERADPGRVLDAILCPFAQEAPRQGCRGPRAHKGSGRSRLDAGR
jgi:hypothetical protein